VTSPPAVIGDTIVVGSAIADGTDKPPPSGEVRGFDAMTGRLRWTWDPVPQAPTAVGADTWKGDSRRSAGGANAWSVIVADPARNLVFVPTGSSIALGGPIVTAGGLVFAAGTLDGAIYAFDVASGKQLWRGTLPTSARATPMTYRCRDGRQYVVVSAGGHGVPQGFADR
jgi:glucose dehydrogenase